MSSLTVLNKTVCLKLRVSLWTGRRRLRAEDLGNAAQNLPPDDLASLGSLKLCNPKRLAELGAIKRAAERECERVCVSFLGGYATEDNNITALAAKLKGFQARFDEKAEAFAQGLQTDIDAWKALHPQWKDIIEEKVPDAAHVRSRFQFSFQAFRVGPASGDLADLVNGGLEEAASGLSGQLFAEIEAEAREAWTSSYEGKDCVGQKALRPLKAILRKLEALRYLDARCQPIIDQFVKVLGSLPRHGPIQDPHLSAVIGLFRVVECGKTLRARGAALLRNRDTAPADLSSPDESSPVDEDTATDLPPPPSNGVHPTPADIDPAPTLPPPPVRSEPGAIWF